MEQKNKRTEINELGEFGLIDRLTSKYSTQQESTIKGVGDDAAILSYGDKLVAVSTDLLIENIHFDLAYHPLKNLGFKAVAVNLSDIYAMNAKPEQVTISIAISNRFSVEAVEEFYKGIYEACTMYGVDLVGGDTTSSMSGFIISVTAIGVVESGSASFRNGAKPGDLICGSGDYGAAYLGLQILEREKQIYMENPEIQPELGGKDYIISRLLKPFARKDIYDQFLSRNLVPTAMIDVSDGLASDLFHICKSSNVGAFLEEANVKIHPETMNTAMEFKIAPITCALSGGEDYELLFTVDPSDLEKVKYMNDIYIMGEIVAPEDGIKLHTRGGKIVDMKAQGWTHF